MAVARDVTSNPSSYGPVASVSWTHTPTPGLSNPCAIVTVNYANLTAAITATVTYDGVSMVDVGGIEDAPWGGGATGYVRTYQLTGIPTASGKTVAVTFSAGGNVGDASCTTYSGVDQTTPCGSIHTNVVGSANNISVTFSVTAGNIGFATIAHDANTLETISFSKTSIFDIHTNYTAAAQDTNSSGSQTFTFSQISIDNWVAAGMEILAAGAGGKVLNVYRKGATSGGMQSLSGGMRG